MERVVNRSELQSEPSTPPSSPDPHRIQHFPQFDFVEVAPQTSNTPQHWVPSEQDEAEELEFQLFAPSTNKNEAAITRIRLQSPDIEILARGFVQPDRDHRYYFTETLTETERHHYEAAALTGTDVLTQSKQPWAGTAYPWRVVHIPATKKQRLLLSTSDALYAKADNPESGTRKRPGKKMRISTRVKTKAAQVLVQLTQDAAELKEAAEREKKTRRNREKKAKKKKREKAKKAGADADAVMVDADEDRSDGTSEEQLSNG